MKLQHTIPQLVTYHGWSIVIEDRFGEWRWNVLAKELKPGQLASLVHGMQPTYDRALNFAQAYCDGMDLDSVLKRLERFCADEAPMLRMPEAV